MKAQVIYAVFKQDKYAYLKALVPAVVNGRKTLVAQVTTDIGDALVVVQAHLADAIQAMERKYQTPRRAILNDDAENIMEEIEKWESQNSQD